MGAFTEAHNDDLSSYSNLRNLKHEQLKPENPKTTNTRQSCNPAKETPTTLPEL